MTSDNGVEEKKVVVSESERDRVSDFLFYLGKGLWKSVPILGPIIEEVLYAQFKDALTAQVSRLSAEGVEAIGNLVPKEDLEAIDKRLDQLTEEVKLNRLSIFENLVFNVDRLLIRLEGMEEKVEPIPNILEIVQQIRDRIDNAEEIRTVLGQLEERRARWISRISVIQTKLLRAIPFRYVSIDEVWYSVQQIIPGCGYKGLGFGVTSWNGLVW